MPFDVEHLAIPGVLVIRPRLIGDDRGFLMETYRTSELERLGIAQPFVQENHSRSVRGSLRGLHFQRGAHAQGKLVRVVSGEIFDVAVDVRPDSPTRGHWVSAVLSAENRLGLYVPPWCAHGFCVTSDIAEVIYKATAEYAPTSEDGVMWNDPALGITWPIDAPILSERDRRWAPFGATTGR